VLGAVTAVAEQSPAITWARDADVLAFVYYEQTDHAIWKLRNPRGLRKAPFRDGMVVAAGGAATVTAAPAVTPSPAPSTTVPPTAAPAVPTSAATVAYLPAAAVRDSAAARQSFYRPITGAPPRASSDLPALAPGRYSDRVSVQAMMDSVDFNLPDTSQFKLSRYRGRLTPEYVAQPSIGYQQGGFGQGTYGGTTVVLGDLLGNRRLALSGALNGQLSDAQVFVGYTSLGRRFQYSTGVIQQPMYLLSGFNQEPQGNNTFLQSQEITRLVVRQVFATGLYPLNRFTRFEVGARFQNVDQQVFPFVRLVDYTFGVASGFQRGQTRNVASANTWAPYLAWVTDNTLFGFTGPISGKRVRLEMQPSVGTWQWTEYLADARAYVPILFNYVTFAARFTGSMAVGRDELRFPKWIGRPDFVRGYNRESLGAVTCTGLPSDDGSACNSVELIGSRVAFANAELRFPIIRQYGRRTTPSALPPVDGLFFYDAGVAWSAGQQVMVNRPAGYDFTRQRAILSSYGFGIRLNLFNVAIVRWDWAVPVSRPGTRGFGTWFFGMSY
ncbi:MAG: hypothetical protein KJT01_14895, partial [Gemmatimonadetes bacterium]|nr:hypothetical protein [Gemmatimonadota bacterium]